ncbi:MAG: hypothetical protein M3Q23_09020 [Actinomycetota bacterium]|nr:hypothetical protein [Actinomycetota bacterium]
MRDDERVRAAIGRAIEPVDAPDPQLERVLGRARRLRRRRIVASVVASMLVLVGIAVPLSLLAGLGRNRAVPGSGRLDAFGIELTLPDGWDGRISWTTDEVGPVFQAGTFPLPQPGGDFLRRAMKAMAPEDIVVALHEFTPSCPCTGFQAVSAPVSIGPGDVVSDPGFDPGHAYAEQAFQNGGRWFVLGVAFGTAVPGAAAEQQANSVLSTLWIDPGLTSGPTGDPAGGIQPPPRFDPAPQWNQMAAGTPAGWELLPLAWASNEPFRAADLAYVARYDVMEFRPDATLRALPPDGVVVVASAGTTTPFGGASQPGNPNFPDRQLPLQLTDADVRTAWEGQVAPNVPEYLILARVGQQDVDVRVYFGTLHPDDATLADAQAELDRLQLPAVEPGVTPTPPTPLQTGTHELDQDDGISIVVPSGWSFLEDPSGPDEPKTVLAVSNVAIPQGGDCAPTAAQDALPQDGVLAWVIEYHDPQGNDFRPRPDRFSLDPGTLAPYECSDVPSYMFRFSDPGRDFQVHVVLGPGVSNADRDQLLASLSSMQVDRCPPPDVPGLVSEIGTLAPGTGPLGTLVTFSGLPTGRTENWFWTQADRIELWWTKRGLPTSPLREFQMKLGQLDLGMECTVSVTFRVPDVPPGGYQITVLIYDRGGFGVEAERPFVVTP